ncbi:uncharacterized protein [Typha latifolia]|uniref:uncharacterized protein n=1 Tax=Typha latifolia TaxID=4733 RepID=UPI003C2AD9CE
MTPTTEYQFFLQDQNHLAISTPQTEAYSFSLLFNNRHDQDGNATPQHDHVHDQQHQQQQQQKKPDDTSPSSVMLDDHCIRKDVNVSRKWVSSKMRWMRKRMISDELVTSRTRRSGQALQDQQQQSKDSSGNSLNGIIRVCSDCNTTRTPLWRSGPRGPKSLCNACGIRQRKARRAMAAAAAAAVSGSLISSEAPKDAKMERREETSDVLPFKKRCKITMAKSAQKKVPSKDTVISMSNHSACHQVFPQDEKNAAILLMALSCGSWLSTLV